MKFIAPFCLLLVIGCSILKKDDPEKDVRSFLAAFSNDLSKSDDEILSRFRVSQSRDAVLAAVDVLRNKDRFIVCDAGFANASITFQEQMIKVEVPIAFRVKDLDSDDTEAFTLALELTATEKSFVITQFAGEEFYQAFSLIKNRNEWDAEQTLALREREPIYQTARKLQEKYDTVIWYSQYHQQTYYYVVAGSWTNYHLDRRTLQGRNTEAKMGLVDSVGNIIIPLEFDLVGSIGFEKSNWVEVIKDGKVGYFDVQAKKLVVEPAYDLLVPTPIATPTFDGVWAVVKQDSTYGWLNDQFQYAAGFPSEQVEQWIENFEFLQQSISLKPDTYAFCEIPSKEYIGNGMIAPPSYLTKHGVFEEIEGYISTTTVPMNGWTEYKETKGSFLEIISAKMTAVVTSIRERYLEGREEFYSSNTLVFINEARDTIHVAQVRGSSVSIHPIDSTLLEVRAPQDYWFMEYEVSDESNLEEYSYFSLSPNATVTPLNSQRLFAQTEFVRLDSTYLSGDFQVFNTNTGESKSTRFLSPKTITYMRDEILASYGYIFPEQEKIDRFKNNSAWYKPERSSIADFEADMTEIDRHNLTFLNKILELMKTPMA